VAENERICCLFGQQRCCQADSSCNLYSSSLGRLSSEFHQMARQFQVGSWPPKRAVNGPNLTLDCFIRETVVVCIQKGLGSKIAQVEGERLALKSIVALSGRHVQRFISPLLLFIDYRIVRYKPCRRRLLDSWSPESMPMPQRGGFTLSSLLNHDGEFRSQQTVQRLHFSACLLRCGCSSTIML
jgi:hypothetical protein